MTSGSWLLRCSSWSEGEVTGLVQGTQVADELVGVQEGVSRLLGIDGLTVVRVDVDAVGARVVHAVTEESVPP